MITNFTLAMIASRTLRKKQNQTKTKKWLPQIRFVMLNVATYVGVKLLLLLCNKLHGQLIFQVNGIQFHLNFIAFETLLCLWWEFIGFCGDYVSLIGSNGRSVYGSCNQLDQNPHKKRNKCTSSHSSKDKITDSQNKIPVNKFTVHIKTISHSSSINCRLIVDTRERNFMI